MTGDARRGFESFAIEQLASALNNSVIDYTGYIRDLGRWVERARCMAARILGPTVHATCFGVDSIFTNVL